MAGYGRGELERINKVTFDQLTRQERSIWKLMKRYHNDPRKLIDTQKTKGEGFDPNYAPTVRFKHPRSWTKEEREWSSMDRVLNPELWRGLKLRQQQEVDTQEKATDIAAYMHPADEVEGEDGEALGTPAPPPPKARVAGSMFGTLVNATLDRSVDMAASMATDGEDWVCALDRGEIMEVWAAKHAQASWTVDQCKAHVLLERFNGDFSDFYEVQKQQIAARAKEAAGAGKNRLIRDQDAETVETDLDARCRSLQAEMDTAINNSNEHMESAVLHGGVRQRYPTSVLRLELERELDCLLREQVYERERATRFLLEQDGDSDLESDSSDEEGENHAGLKKPDNVSKGVYQARKAALTEGSKDEATKQLERDLAALGPRACFACRQRTCEWKSSIEYDKITARRQAISDELVYVRMHPDIKVLESYVPLSSSRGGNPHFRREDLLHELTWEDTQLAMRMQLNALDRELHDAFATTKEYMEVKALHSYPTMMWTNNARRALDREHNRYVAMVVASDIVDDALDWMLEGWHFGERESNFSVAGYVPSLRPDGFVRAGTDQVLAQAAAENRAAERIAAEREGAPPQEAAISGSPRSKAAAIEAGCQFRLGTEKVVKAGSEREQHLDFTERTLKFGLFSITLMFFRAMSLVQREKESWSGMHDAIGGEESADRIPPTDERRKLRREQQKQDERQKKLGKALARAKVGEERTRRRIEKERAEAARKLHEKVRREKRELQACGQLQAFYRGHLGRKAARRWAIKRAELEAMNALMTASAITIERVFRGYMGRIAASVARMEMAEFISMIRMEEAAADEDEYWKSHSYARLKRNIRMFVHSTVANRKSNLGEEDLALVQKLTSSMEDQDVSADQSNRN